MPPQYAAEELRPAQERGWPAFRILRERSMILLVLANVLWMGGYSLWSNWTTLYLVHVHHLSLEQTKKYVWIPPLISNLGAFLGGWLSLRWSKHGTELVAARRRAVWVSAVCSLVTLLLPFAPDAAWATAVISLSFFFALAGSVNIYALPIDIFGAGRSGLAIAALTCAFGILQTVISPIIGFLGDRQLYNEVLWIVTTPLLLSALVLQALRREPSA
jgi:MFS transporter, ACS family, aldohexuronate transporter